MEQAVYDSKWNLTKKQFCEKFEKKLSQDLEVLKDQTKKKAMEELKNWQEFQIPGGSNYYYNKLTGNTQFSKPFGFIEDRPMVPPNPKLMETLAKQWEQKVEKVVEFDPETDEPVSRTKIFFVNKVTGEETEKKPPGFKGNEEHRLLEEKKRNEFKQQKWCQNCQMVVADRLCRECDIKFCMYCFTDVHYTNRLRLHRVSMIDPLHNSDDEYETDQDDDDDDDDDDKKKKKKQLQDQQAHDAEIEKIIDHADESSHAEEVRKLEETLSVKLCCVTCGLQANRKFRDWIMCDACCDPVFVSDPEYGDETLCPEPLEFPKDHPVCEYCDQDFALHHCVDCDVKYCEYCKQLSHQQDASYLAPSDKFSHEWIALPTLNKEKLQAGEEYCSECETKKASRCCDQCGDGFCQKCYETLHGKGNRRNHTWEKWQDVRTGWEEFYDEDEDCFVYHNINTKETTSEKPLELMFGPERAAVVNEMEKQKQAEKKKQELVDMRSLIFELTTLKANVEAEKAKEDAEWKAILMKTSASRNFAKMIAPSLVNEVSLPVTNEEDQEEEEEDDFNANATNAKPKKHYAAASENLGPRVSIYEKALKRNKVRKSVIGSKSSGSVSDIFRRRDQSKAEQAYLKKAIMGQQS